MFKVKFKYSLFTILIVFHSIYLFAQTTGCIDINNRITYSLPLNGGLFTSPLSATTNIIMGGYQNPNDSGIIIAKTYLDNIVWAKKYQSIEKEITFENAVQLPDNSIVANSASYARKDFFLARFAGNGNLLWAKKYQLSIPNLLTYQGNATNNSIVYSNGFIYISTIFSSTLMIDDFYNVVAKLDLDGNPVWTKTLRQNKPVYITFSDPPIVNADIVTIVANANYKNKDIYRTDSLGTILTRIDANTGDIIAATKIKTTPDNFIKGAFVVNAKIFKDNSACLTGIMGAYYPGQVGITPYTDMPFVLKLDADLNFVAARYFTYPIQGAIGNDAAGLFPMSANNNKQNGFLLRDIYNNLAYTLLIDSNLTINRTRVFYPNVELYFDERTFDLDDNVTSIYGFSHYNTTLQRTELEYFRINNLTPSNTLDCFGRDTSVFVPHSFKTVKDTFVWDIQLPGMLLQTSLNLIEKPLTITKETVCTQTSICDTIKIKGESVHCLSNPNASFTVYKNPQCLRKINWQIDTNAIKIIDQPNDSIINVQFIKPFHGYIRAAFEGCVLKDSLYIDVYPLISPLFLGNDTTFCPGKSITLNAGPGFKTYKWQDNSINSTFSVNKPGTYSVQTTDSCGNVFRDTIIVKPLDVTLNLNYPNTLCLSDTAMIALDSRLHNYLWSPADAAINQNNVLKLFPGNNTLFTISAEPFNGCTISDTLLVKVKVCPEYVYIPTAFTPNNDGINDIFKPIVSGHVEQYSFSVYNRFGQQIFSSQKINEGWDGTIKGKPQDTGTFIWTCSYKFRNEKNIYKKGTIVLIR